MATEPIPLREVTPLVPMCCNRPMNRLTSPLTGQTVLTCIKCGGVKS